MLSLSNENLVGFDKAYCDKRGDSSFIQVLEYCKFGSLMSQLVAIKDDKNKKRDPLDEGIVDL